MNPRLCIESRPAGDRSCWPGSALITRSNSNRPAGDRSCWPWDPSRELHRVRPGVDHSMELQLGPHGSRVVHYAGAWIQGTASSPARRGSQLLARSALITRWDSNQVPMDLGLCILLAMGSSVVHHAGPWIHRGDCIEYRPEGDRSCKPSRSRSICRRSQLLALGSRVVHHAGL
jgi:hypothetical protein